MKSIPLGKKLPAPVRTKTVFMGRMDFLNTLLRLIIVELYKIRRRAMSKVLISISIIISIAVFGLISLGAIDVLNSPIDNYTLPQCSQVSDSTQPCLNHPPTKAELTQAAQSKQEALRNISDPLRLPNSLGVATQVARNIGLILIIILAGTIVGGEYTVGTVRLMFTRGPTRTQFLLAKIGTIIACTLIGFLLMIIIGMLVGAFLNIFTGITPSLTFLTGLWIWHAILYILVAMFGLFTYAMMALFLATLGRASVAGVAGALVWSLLEPVIGGALFLIGSFNKSPVGDFLKAIPDYFIGNNIGTLLQNQSHFILNDQPAAQSDLHAILVLATYLVLFIGLSLWINTRRDVTN